MQGVLLLIDWEITVGKVHEHTSHLAGTQPPTHRIRKLHWPNRLLNHLQLVDDQPLGTGIQQPVLQDRQIGDQRLRES